MRVPKFQPHLACLQVASAPVGQDRVAGDVPVGVGSGDVRAQGADHRRDLQLVVEGRGAWGDGHVVVRSADRGAPAIA